MIVQETATLFDKASDHTASTRLVLPDSGEDEEKQLRDKMAAEAARRDEAIERRQRLCTQMVSVRTALYSLVLVLNQVKPTQATVKSLPKQFDWDAEQDFVDSLYAVRRGPAGAPEANGRSPRPRDNGPYKNYVTQMWSAFAPVAPANALLPTL